MWKVKDDVDLEEVEKFGFWKDSNFKNLHRGIYDNYIELLNKMEYLLILRNRVIVKAKLICIMDLEGNFVDGYYIQTERVKRYIQDLIQARISRKGVVMKVIDFIEKIRDLKYKLALEFRQENYFLKQEIVDNVYAIDLKLLDREIDNWFVDFEKQKIVIDLEKE